MEAREEATLWGDPCMAVPSQQLHGTPETVPLQVAPQITASASPASTSEEPVVAFAIVS